MTVEELTKKQEELEASIAALTKRAEDAEFEAHIAKLGDRAEAYESLSKEDKEAYRKADEPTRNQMLDKADDALSKADEPEVPEVIQKQLDSIKKQLEDETAKRVAAEAVAKQANDAREMAELIKRAETEFPGLPGTPEEKGKVLKSLTKLSDEEQKEVEKLLAAGNACLTKITDGVGKDVSKGGDNAASVQLEKLAEKRATEKGISKAVAYEQVVTENPALYDRYLKEEHGK